MSFYSFDYWARYTGLDIYDLHRQHQQLITYRSGALEFLRWLRTQGKHTIIATNAHPGSIAVKEAQLELSQEVDQVVSSDEFQAPKESLDYWQAMQQRLPFDVSRSVFIDDNEPVLDHAQDYGIKHLWTITTPDSQRPARSDLSYPCFDSFS